MQSRRDHVVGEAVRAGKFSPRRAKHWRTQYDRDPAGTEAALALLQSPLDGPQPYPRELFPELAKGDRVSRFRALGSLPVAKAATPISRTTLPGPGQVRSAAPSPARSARRPSPSGAGPDVPRFEDVADWSEQLGFPDNRVVGRVTRAAD
jgi:hypothetical protein